MDEDGRRELLIYLDVFVDKNRLDCSFLRYACTSMPALIGMELNVDFCGLPVSEHPL